MRWVKKYKLIKKYVVDKYIYLASHYHRLFFGSLIFICLKFYAFNVFSNIKYELKKKENFDPYLIFFVAMLRVTPELILGNLPLGSVKYGVPLPITETKKITFAVKWIIKLLKDKNSFFTVKSISELLIDSVYSKGDSIMKKQEVYNTAHLNRHLIRKLFK